MPLVWAHAEFVKLAASLKYGHPVDRPAAVWLRYGGEKPRAERTHWTRRARISTITRGQTLRWLLDGPTLVHYGIGGWDSARDVATRAGVLGLHVADLQTDALRVGETLRFTMQDLKTGLWDAQEHVVTIIDAVT
jgi:glucoamylase